MAWGNAAALDQAMILLCHNLDSRIRLLIENVEIHLRPHPEPQMGQHAHDVLPPADKDRTRYSFNDHLIGSLKDVGVLALGKHNASR